MAEKDFYDNSLKQRIIQELVPGALKGVHGYVNYQYYESLK